MLFEQAFVSMPEFLLGVPYEQQSYEGGVVLAFSLALLQELNGRNVRNPISCLNGEVLYLPGERSLRADLKLDLDAIGVLNPQLLQYGWRQVNWLEAKFFRPGQAQGGTYNKSQNTNSIAGDLIRLCCLVPEAVGRPSPNARYFLHVYQGQPQRYTTVRRYSQPPVTQGFSRDWLSRLWLLGRRQLSDFRFGEETAAFDSEVGSDMRELELEMTVTNLTSVPAVAESEATLYWCYLTRIDSARVARGAHSFAIDESGSVTEGAQGDFDAIRDFVVDRFRRQASQTVSDQPLPPLEDDTDEALGAGGP